MSIEGVEWLATYENKLKQDVSNMLNNIMADVLTEIVVLVNSGRNVFNQPFQPYSQSYQDQRRKKGLRTTPNMQYTSDMINSLNVAKRSKYVYTIGVVGSDRKGVSNSEKLRKLEQMKNYKILFWSDRLKKIADEYWKKL
jgi:hypothetical protein